VWIPALLRDLTGGQARVTAPGRTVRQVIASLEATYPGFRARLCQGDDVNLHFAVVVDGQVSRLRMLEEVSENGEIQFVPAIHGGTYGGTHRGIHRGTHRGASGALGGT
jgi:sulfur-carrier protein